MNSDPASLANLNDIVLPASPAWWPLAPGWYGLMLVFLAGLFWVMARQWKRYRCNRYRRAALEELAMIESAQTDQAYERLPALLKRTALHAYPREQIAALSGDQWRDFLNRHCDSMPFNGTAGVLLNQLAYQPEQLALNDLQPLLEGVRIWIRQHQVSAC